jgi:L-seryl-tRNA(Ser) seleniumtransferase
MKNQILIQKPQRYAADPCFRFAGAKLVEVGDVAGCTTGQIEDAIGADTAAIAYVVHPDYSTGAVPLEEAAAVGRRNGVPLIVDAAAQVYPIDYFRRTAQSAELVCFSSKYYGGPNSAGFVTGKRELIDAVAALGFASNLPYDDIPTGGGYAFGRGMKLDRQEIVALLVAIDTWCSMNHEDRFQEYDRKMAVIQRHLEGIAGVRAHPEPYDSYLAVRLHVTVEAASGSTAQQVVDELDAGTPRIKTGVQGDDVIIVPHTLNPGEESTVGERLRAVLTG